MCKCLYIWCICVYVSISICGTSTGCIKNPVVDRFSHIYILLDDIFTRSPFGRSRADVADPPPPVYRGRRHRIGATPTERRPRAHWDFRRLSERRSRALFRAAVVLATNDHFLEALAESLTVEQRRFKGTTNVSHLRVQGRDVDPGNYAMALAWEIALPMLEELRPGLLGLLQERWHVLADPDGRHLSNHAVEQRGDMIDFVLYGARHTGPAVPPGIRQNRHAFSRALIAFLNEFEVTQRSLSNEYAPVRSRPCPAALAALVRAQSATA